MRLRKASTPGSRTALAGVLSLAIEEKIGPMPLVGVWERDHIVPSSFFFFLAGEDHEPLVRLWWHPENMRWLTRAENGPRKDKLLKQEIMEFNHKQLEILFAATNKAPKYNGWHVERLLQLEPSTVLPLQMVKPG